MAVRESDRAFVAELGERDECRGADVHVVRLDRVAEHVERAKIAEATEHLDDGTVSG